MPFPATYDIEFITPAFLVGATPDKAELRAPSIRGQLRWWFRVLGEGLPSAELPGGLREAERRVFGGVHNDQPTASSLQVRVRVVRYSSNPADLPRMEITEPLYYLYYFAKVSDSDSNRTDGPRTKKDAFFSPGSTFQLQLSLRRPLAPHDQKLLERAVDTFHRLGSLGLRATRGCGALVCLQATFRNAEALTAWAKGLRNVDVYCVGDGSKDWKEAQHSQATFLKTFRMDNHLSGKRLTPLGAAMPRQSSALHLRPVRLADGSILPLAFYTPSVLPANVANQPFRQLLEKTEGVSQLA